MSYEVSFADLDLDRRARSHLHGILRRVEWREPVRHIEVMRLMTGGASGARVLQVLVTQRTSQLVRVIKFAPASELAGEWRAYAELIAPYANAFCAPVIEASPEVKSSTPGKELAAIVYDHVGQHSGAPAGDVDTLEEVVRAAVHETDPASAVRILDQLLVGAAHVLHNRFERIDEPSSLRFLNVELGPNLTVALDGTDGTEELVPHDEVLCRTLCGDQGDIAVGEHIALDDLRLIRTGTSPIATGDEIEVVIQDRSAYLANTVEAIRIHGVVVEVRGARHRARIARAMVGLEEVRCADPFELLPRVLTEALPGRIASIAHGDLNPRNILLARAQGRPYLIDYAKTRPKRPQQSDFCWLEVGLFRDVFVDLPFTELLHLQRCLALGSVLLTFGMARTPVQEALTGLVGDGLMPAFQTLFAVRANGYQVYPSVAGQPWWLEYQRILLVTAHHAIKWTGVCESPAQLRAASAVASATSEWLDDRNPFRCWNMSHVDRAVTAVVPLLPLESDAAVRLLVRLIEAAESFGPTDSQVELAVDRARTRLVRIRCAEAARRLLVELGPLHDDYIDLPAEASNRGALRTVIGERDVLLAGEAGSGKSTVARELAWQEATEVLNPAGVVRMPHLVVGPRTDWEPSRMLAGSGLESIAAEALALGAVRVIFDGIDDSTPEDQQLARIQLRSLRARFPRSWLLICQRAADLDASTVVRISQLGVTDMTSYLHHSLAAHLSRGQIEHLLRSLLDDPAWERTPLQLPMWLALVAGHIRANGMPQRMPPPGELVGAVDRLGPSLIPSRLRQEQMAARELVHVDMETLTEKLRWRRWHEVLRMFVALGDVSAGTVLHLVGAVRDADPVFAAQLLAGGGVQPESFAAGQRETLRDHGAGPARWRLAARALLEVGGLEGTKTLEMAAIDRAAPEEARREAIDCLGALYHRTLSTKWQRVIARAVLCVARSYLANAEPDPLRARAVDLVSSTRLSGLELLIGQFVDPNQPWPVVRAAVAALRVLGIELTTAHCDAYHVACRRRLATVDTLLLTSTAFAQARAVQAERLELIAALAGVESESWLLHRRFQFGASRQVSDELERRLRRTAPAAELLERVRSDDDLIAIAAAHRLLRDAPHTAGRIVTAMDTDASNTGLLIAAAALPHAGPNEVAAAENLVCLLAPVVEDDRLEGLAALLIAFFGVHREAGLRLALAVDDILVARNLQARHHWPWPLTMAKIQRNMRELDSMLCAGGDSGRIAAAVLASRDFHRSALPGPRYRFSDQARRWLLARTPTVEWILAVAGAGLFEALPRVLEFVPEAGVDGVSRTSSRYGRLEQAPLADTLAVAGHLARRAHEAGETSAEIVRTHRLLAGLDTHGHHPSVENGRLIGLAYLGDWLPLLDSRPDEPRMTAAANNVLEWWLPGPAGAGGHRDLAEWIVRQLSNRQLSGDQRWFLDELLQHAQTTGGILILDRPK